MPFTTGTGTVSDASRDNLVDASFIQQLTGESLQGLVSTISVSPNGFTLSGILTNFGCDISNGGFAMADFSFAGVGEFYQAPAPTGTSYSEQSSMPASFTPVTSTHVSGQITTGCANSFRFSLDLPNEQLSCLGGVVTGTQTLVANNFLMVSKPPFKATITVEGTSVDVPTVGSNQYIVGYLAISLPNGKVTSHSFNQAVGNVGATYNYNLEDTSAIFSDYTGVYAY